MARGEKFSFLFAVLAFAAGMGGELHLFIPALGYIAMLDLASYVVAPFILMMYWSRMGKFMRRSLGWAFAWTTAAMVANFLNFVEWKYWAKCVAVISSSWSILAAAYFIFRSHPKTYLWYLVGAGLSAWISMYYFRNGSLDRYAFSEGLEAGAAGVEFLQDKQFYPMVARGILYGCVLPFFIWWRKIPVFFVLVSVLVGGFWLLFHGGSRSSFGMFGAAAGAGFLVAYGRRAFARMGRRPFLMVALMAMGGTLLFSGYKYMAMADMLQEGQKEKYEKEFGEGSKGALEGRAGFSRAVKDAVESCFIGKGCHLRNHSVFANSLACEGLIGFFFWLYFSLQVFWFVCRRLPYSGKYAAFIVLMLVIAEWDVFGSPFGARHKFFVSMAFIALCRDNPYYGLGTMFDNLMCGGRRRLTRSVQGGV